ncbi:MAG: phosphatase PAP2 family protein [Thermoleophilaceae bacterium]|nr:phosphatase PAP2 family protein [Thermoleophilaceae bacterium]
MRTRGHAPAAERAAQSLALTGEWGAVWAGIALTSGLLGDPAQRGSRFTAALAVPLATLPNYAVKLAVRRARPGPDDHPYLTPTVSRLSYPSAHATTSFLAARLLSRSLSRAPLYVLATAIAATRPYLGVHYPSDVVAGAAFGTALARFVR